jgi:predicted DNA-binding transcriptional regulator YafY
MSTTLRRLVKIHSLLEEERYPSVARLVEELEISERTVKRDIDTLKTTFGLPIKYDRDREGYYYTCHVEAFPMHLVSDQETEQLEFLREWIEGLRHHFFYKDLKKTVDKIADLGVHVNPDPNYQSPIAIRPKSFDRIDPDLFQTLHHSIYNGHEIAFDYKKTGSTTKEKRKLQPYLLVFSGNRWYLHGRCPDKQEERSFVLHRISNLKVNKTAHFTKPKDFNAQGIFDHSISYFGNRPGQKLYDIRLKFDRKGTNFLEETFTHPSLRIKRHTDGSSTVSLRLNNLNEATSWVLHWGDRVTVIAPEELKQSVVELAQEVVRRNSNP